MLGRGCARNSGGDRSAPTMSREELLDYRLTDHDVEKYIRDLPKVAEDMKGIAQLGERGPLGVPGGLLKARGLLNELRELGWEPPERFFAVQYAITTAMVYASAQEGRGELKRALENPELPPEARKQLEEALGATEPPNETVAHNVRVVSRHLDELRELHRSLGM